MLLTVRWGQLKPSQPSRRVARWGQIRPSQRHPAASQVGPLQAALPGPNQVVTATLDVGTDSFNDADDEPFDPTEFIDEDDEF
jgi:hypothetical protein